VNQPSRRIWLKTTPLWLAGLVSPAWVLAAGADDDTTTRLRQGGVAVLLRHARTEPGIGDPPGFQPGVCSTQRQLSADGRDQSRALGAWFAARRLKPAAVRSSAWCRCLDTAMLAFATVQPWPALDSFFGDSSTQAAQTQVLRKALAELRPGAFEVWVTHMVNISALTGEGAAMGEGLLVGADARIHGRLNVAR